MKLKLPSLLVHAALILGAAVTLTPLLWMVSASLMPAGAANSVPPPFLPRHVTFEHYVHLFTRLHLARTFGNSLFITVTATVVSLVINAMAGYAFAKLRFAGREPLFRALMAALVIPAQVGMMPLFLMI